MTHFEAQDVLGNIPYRMAFAGGWIDQPFISRMNPNPPGSMVVVSIHPTVRFMEYCGMATSTRKVAMELWKKGLPQGDPAQLVHDLYTAENQGKVDPSGSQDMAGIVYSGISRLDYDCNFQGGYFPIHVESNNDPEVGCWMEKVINIIPVAQRPFGYSPLGDLNLDPEWIERLSQSGKDCYNAIINKDAQALGASLNLCMDSWEKVLPQTIRHPLIKVNLIEILKYYQDRYAGAMYSGCGGGYLFVVSEEPVPGASHVQVRTNSKV